MFDNFSNFPVSTPEVAKMFGFFEGGETVTSGASQNEYINQQSGKNSVLSSDLPIANLPVAGPHQSVETQSQRPIDRKLAALDEQAEPGFMLNQTGSESKAPRMKKLAKLLPYLAVFVAGVAIYYFLFHSSGFGISLGGMAKSVSGAAAPKETALAQLQKQGLADYYQWIGQFYYDVSDASILDPNRDNSGNGLTNFQKFLLNLNPKSYDTMGLGLADSQALAEGLNPLTGGQLTDAQKKIVAQYFDLEVASNRLALANLHNAQNVAGAEVISLGQWFRGSSTLPAALKQPSEINAPATDQLQVNTSIPGRLEIPSLNINTPIIWTKDAKDFDNDLQSGVVHYPGTALPGESGTSYLSGHSSNYLWAKGNFNQVFSKLGDLAVGSSFKVTVIQKNGRDAVLHYAVTSKKEFAPADQEQFRSQGKSMVALSTCWPINSTAKRLVAFGELIKVEK